ncbi:hypothetical protein CHS0354_006072 [Potamilus streckersoni]|uniref:Uncharacterized protein n=1 Tax=Potamilus streckersoni TaxID=2493646 RepID=A0AAE0VTQ8_9BIVA|nr:hypothetical protein CHS0354_006072 [Potamilus streckersoni]
MEDMEKEKYICSVFSLPKKCYPRFNKFQKQLLRISTRFQVTLEKFHKLTQTEVTENLHHIKQTVKNLADAKEVQVAIFGNFHDEISSCDMVTAKDSKYLMPDCVPSRFRRNEGMAQSVQCSDAEGKPVVHVYMIYVDKSDNLEELSQKIQQDLESLGFSSFKDFLLLVGLDPSLQREDSSMKSFEKAMRHAFHATVEEGCHGQRVCFKSSTVQDLISSKGELPKMIQFHLEWKVIQPFLDMRELIESNTHKYKKKFEKSFQGPVAFEESLKERFSQTFLNKSFLSIQGYILDALLGKFFFQEGKLDHSNLTEILLENLAQVLQCLMVDALANIYGIKEYHVLEMLEGMIFKECSNTMGDSMKEILLPKLSEGFLNYDCRNLQNETDRNTFCGLFSKTHCKSFLYKMKTIVNTGIMIKIAYRVHEELEKRMMPIDRNLAIQHKLKFEIESILKQTVASNYITCQLPPSDSLIAGLKDDLIRIEGFEGLAMVCGELHVYCTTYSSEEKKKYALKQVDNVIAKHKYGQSYKIGIITRKPKLFYSVGSTLHCPQLKRRGTLGGFMIDTDGHLHCLTCAHIVPDDADVHVEISGQQMEPITIGRSVSMNVQEELPYTIVDHADIMAVKVNEDQRARCIPYFKTADGESGSSVMIQPFDRSLKEYPKVYKWGATSNLTHGLLHTGDYSRELFNTLGLNDQKYIYVLVESPPVDDDSNGTFASPGDSGAIICNETEDNAIETVAMIQGGDMDIRTGSLTVNYCLGFYLWCGLDKLLTRYGLELTPVNFPLHNE